MEVVCGLCEDSGPVDRIDRSQVESLVDLGVCEKSLDSVLEYD